MKKISIIFILSMTLCLSACTKSENDGEASSKSTNKIRTQIVLENFKV